MLEFCAQVAFALRCESRWRGAKCVDWTARDLTVSPSILHSPPHCHHHPVLSPQPDRLHVFASIFQLSPRSMCGCLLVITRGFDHLIVSTEYGLSFALLVCYHASCCVSSSLCVRSYPRFVTALFHAPCSSDSCCSSSSLKARIVLAERRRTTYMVWVEWSISSNCRREDGSRC